MIAAVAALTFAACSDGNGSDEPSDPNNPDAPGVGGGGSADDLSAMQRLIIGKWQEVGRWYKDGGFTEYDEVGFPIITGGKYSPDDGYDYVFNEDGSAEEWWHYNGRISERGTYRWVSANGIMLLRYGAVKKIKFDGTDRMLIHWMPDGWTINVFERIED